MLPKSAYEDVLINFFRSLLIVVSIVSFSPQINRIRHEAGCAGISIFYVLFNLIVTTYNLTVMLCAVTDSDLVQKPPGLLDWLNVAQFAATWLCQLTLYVQEYLAMLR